MPNWSSSNTAVRGDRKEVEALAGLINSLPSREPFMECDFGPFWLGYLVHALGGDWETVGCRGVVDPDPEAPACWFFEKPDPDGRVSAEGCGDGKALMRCSIRMAHGLDKRLLAFLKERFPSLEFFWKSTDDCGNYHVIHDPEGLIQKERYELEGDGEWLLYDDKHEFLEALRGITGLDIPDGVSDTDLSEGETCRRFCEWRDRREEEDDEAGYVGYTVWIEQ